MVLPQKFSSYRSGGEDVPEHFWYIFFIPFRGRRCTGTFLVHQVERLLSSVTCGSKPSVINFTVSCHPSNR